MVGETAGAASSQDLEILLAQRLAANEKPVRTKALKTLRKYINLRSQKETGGFTSEDLMKIWKGLFYCLWMQDKPILQEELSERISGLFHSFHTSDSQLLYFETFLQTIKREWNGIDRLRMDKFFQLVRFVFRESFEVLKRREWDSSVVNQLLEVFTAQLLQSTTRVPDSLMLHVLELYLTELARVGAVELTAEQNLFFIDPFCKTLAKTKERSVLRFISKNIFSTIVDQASCAVKDLLEEMDHGEDSDSGQDSEMEQEAVEADEPQSSVFKKAKRKEDNGDLDAEDSDEGHEDDLLDLNHTDPEKKESDEDIGPVLQFDYGALADRLFELGSRVKTPNFNRAKIYRLVKIFRDLSEGIFPQDDEVDLLLKKKDQGSNNKKNKRKRRRVAKTVEEESPTKKHKACEDVQNLIEAEGDDGQSYDAGVKKKLQKGNQKPKDKRTVELDPTKRDNQLIEPAIHTPPETRGAEAQAETPDNEPSSQSELEASVRRKKRRKGKKCMSELQEVGEEVPTEHDSDMKHHTDMDEVNGCPHSDPLKEVDSGAQPTVPSSSGRTKKGKKGKSPKECTVVDTDVSVPAKKQKQECATADACLSSSSLVETSVAEQSKAVSKKKKKQKKVVEDDDKAEIAIKLPEESCASDQKVDLVSAAIVPDSVKLNSDVNASSRKKKKGKQKLKEITAETDQVTEPKGSNDDPNTENQASEIKLLKKRKTKSILSSEQKEPEAKVDAACTASKALKKKKTKKEKRQLVALTDENEKSQTSEASDEPVLKKRKQKQSFKAEIDSSPTVPLIKGKKMKKMMTQEAETSQINTQTVKLSSTSKTPKKKLKMKDKSGSNFASFQGQTKAPSPLFCKVKPKGSFSSPLSSLKTFQSPKSETKKVTFGLKNNKTTEFKKTDRSLSVSPVGLSRVAFDPEKQPTSSVLKSPMSLASITVKKKPTKRPTAADFF